MDLLDSWFHFDVGEGAFYAVFGLIFVALGITLLVLILMGVGKIMSAVNERKEKKRELNSLKEVQPVLPVIKEEDGVPPEEVAAITAALMAYYTKQQAKCDFVVRRIKKL